MFEDEFEHRDQLQYQKRQRSEINNTMFVLSPDIPEAEKAYYDSVSMMFGKFMALGNLIRSKDSTSILMGLAEIQLLLDMGLYHEARKVTTEILTQLQMSRSYDGFQTLYGQHGIQRTEEVSRISQTAPDSQKRNFITRMFKGKEKPQQQAPYPLQQGER